MNKFQARTKFMEEIGIYIHWPFCKSKCPYCDFNSHVEKSYAYDQWLSGYLREISYYQEYLSNKKIVSIFFGGGTPSLMHPKIPEQILNHLSKITKLINDVEITLEANPTSYEQKKFLDFRTAGINRVSIGVQSLDESALKFLGREHSTTQAINAIKSAANIFDRYSFDLIYARPNQTLNDWKRELDLIDDFIGDHISLYQLTIEKGTKFYSMYKNHEFALPDDEASEDMYDYTEEFLNKHNIYPYEISNYAKQGNECKHNLGYWRYNDYLGIGPGAHSRINGFAVMDIHSPNAWMQSVITNGHGIQSNIKLSDEEIAKEKLMMNLRIFEPVKIDSQFMNIDKLRLLHDNKLIILDNNQFYVTKKGLRLHNSVVNAICKN